MKSPVVGAAKLTGLGVLVSVLAPGEVTSGTGPHTIPKPSYSASKVCFRDGATDALLQEAGRLVVHVVDPGGEALPTAEVTLSSGPRSALVSQTDRAGRVSYSDLKDGRYEVRVELPGFVSAHVKKVVVRYGCMSAVSVPLDVADIID